MAKKFLYQRIADDLRTLILQDVYLPGEKLPSIRHLSQARQVSIATIQKSLESLEMKGLIEAKPKSGYYRCLSHDKSISSHVPSGTPSGTESPANNLAPKSVEIHELATRILNQCEADNVINLGTSYPVMRLMPFKALQKIASHAVKHNMPDILEVHFSNGHPLLRKVIAKRLKISGCRVTPDDLIVTSGCLEALSVCLRAVAKSGDTIAVESPGFVGSLQLIESLGYQVIEIPCNSARGISLDALELALEQWEIAAVLVVPSYSNPIGSCMPEDSRKRLVKMLAAKQIPLIEDDLLADLSFDGARAKPCKAFDDKGLVLYCSSASKTIASGLRVGWIAPGIYFKEVSYYKTFTNISAPQFSQLVVAEFINSGKYSRHVRQLSAKLAKQMALMKQLIEAYFPPHTQVSSPKGGCILWVILPKSINGFVLYQAALKIGVGIIPGQLMTTTHKFDHCIRINCACDPAIDIKVTIQKLAKAAYQLL